MLLLDLPVTEYGCALEIQRALVERRIAQRCPDVLILLEHPATITIGARGGPTDLLVTERELADREVALHWADRGGEATYHGPGQLVAYPVMDLRARRISVRDYVDALEETILRTLRALGVEGFRQQKRPGVWIGPSEKIASIGVKISRRVTYHGFSLNVDLTMDPCALVIACGEPETRMVSLNQRVPAPVSMEMARDEVKRAFCAVFSTDLVAVSLDRLLS